MVPAFRRCAPFAHECAESGGRDPGQKERQENYRSYGSSRHFRKLYLRLYETCKPAPQQDRSTGSGSPTGVQTTSPENIAKGLGLAPDAAGLVIWMLSI